MNKIKTYLQDSLLFESKKKNDERGYLWKNGIEKNLGFLYLFKIITLNLFNES